MRRCLNCGKETHNPKYCSCSCSITCRNRGRQQSEETRRKISQALTRFPKTPRLCVFCGAKFTPKKRKQTYCSNDCVLKKVHTSPGFKAQCRKAGRISAAITVRRSKNERYMADLCEEHFDLVWTNRPMFNGWDADIILPDIKLAILWNGVWHYKKVTEKHSLSQVQNRDVIKMREIKQCGYTPYVIKDMGKANKRFVESEFQKLLQWIKEE